MNILVLNWKSWDDPEAGGGEHNVFYLSKYLISKGHNIAFFCRKTKPQDRKNVIPPENRENKIKKIEKGNRLTVYLWAIYYYNICCSFSEFSLSFGLFGGFLYQ